MSHPSPGLDLLVNKSDWKQSRIDEAAVPTLEGGQVLFRVDRFALTANNISYALSGDMLGYWRFFPAPDGWGRIPAMGFGDVVESNHPDVAVGTRCFGFYPMSRYLVVTPSAASPAQIFDGAPHREGLAPAYNQYQPSDADALYAPEHEDALMLMRGLFMTSFLADDFLADADHYGASSVLISSASSKTSIALAHQTAQGGRARAVGLTSARNEEFVRKLGCYDEVVLYDQVASLDPAVPSVYVDLAGSGPVLKSIHEHFGDALKYSCTIGATHWEADRAGEDLTGPAPEFFFAPAQIQKRAAEWGPAELQQKLAAAWSGFRAFSESWLTVERSYGANAARAVYDATVAGDARPDRGYVVSLWDSAEEASGS